MKFQGKYTETGGRTRTPYGYVGRSRDFQPAIPEVDVPAQKNFGPDYNPHSWCDGSSSRGSKRCSSSEPDTDYE